MSVDSASPASQAPAAPPVTYGGYTFTVAEMHRVVAAQRAEARRVAALGAAALDDLPLDDLLGFDMGRTLAVIDYYHLVHARSA